MLGPTPMFIPGGLGPPELLVILLLAVLLFGANKIPKLARSTGQAMGEFQKGRQQVEQELEEMEEAMDPEADLSESNDEYMDLDNEEDMGLDEDANLEESTTTETDTTTDEA